jgi:hypothetical protein
MSDDRKPGYDFYPPARSTNPANPHSGPPSRQYSEPPNHPYSTPLTVNVPRQLKWADGIPPVHRSGVPGWLIVLLALVLGLVGTGILAAVAIPVFLSQRLKADYQATTVHLPAKFNGHKQNTTAQAKTMAKSFAVDDIQIKDVAVYGTVGPGAVIIVALKPPAAMSDVEQAAQRKDIERAFAAEGTPLTLIQDPDPGELGGWIGCGSIEAGLEICLATSAGSLVTVISAAGGADPVKLLRQARAATVSHS